MLQCRPGVQNGAAGKGFSIRHMLHLVPGGKDGISAHYLLPDTSSGQMDSGQASWNTFSREIFLSYRNKVTVYSGTQH